MKRTALTLVEILVAICMVGVLIALLLPAISAANRAAENAKGQPVQPMSKVEVLATYDIPREPLGCWANARVVRIEDKRYLLFTSGNGGLAVLPLVDRAEVMDEKEFHGN